MAYGIFSSDAPKGKYGIQDAYNDSDMWEKLYIIYLFAIGIGYFVVTLLLLFIALPI